LGNLKPEAVEEVKNAVMKEQIKGYFKNKDK
jgi:hypothetical protein